MCHVRSDVRYITQMLPEAMSPQAIKEFTCGFEVPERCGRTNAFLLYKVCNDLFK